MTKLTDKTTAMPLPEGAEGVFYDGANSIGFYLNGELRFIHFPHGTYRFLFTTKTATEEHAASIVQIISNGKISGRPQYRRYDRDNELPARMWTRDARHSLETLLRSKNLDDKNNYAIIEKL